MPRASGSSHTLEPGDAGVVAARRRRAGGLGSAPRGAGSPTVRVDRRGAGRPAARHAVRRDAGRCCGTAPNGVDRGRDRRPGHVAGRRGCGHGDDRRVDAPARRRSGSTAADRCRTCWPARCGARAPGSSTAADATPASRPRPTDLVGAVGLPGRRSAGGARAARRADAAPAGAGARRHRAWSARWSFPGDELPALRRPASQRPRRGAGPRSPRSCATPSAAPTGPPCWPPPRSRSTRSTASSGRSAAASTSDRAAQPPPTLDTTLEFDVNTGSIVARRWSRHPRCPAENACCQSLQARQHRQG